MNPCRWSIAVLSAALLVAGGCGGSTSRTASSSSTTEPMMASHAMEEMPPLPDYTKTWTSRFLAPADGVTVTENTLSLEVATDGFSLDCDEAGKPVRPETGQYHVTLDGTLIDMACVGSFELSMLNVEPGTHELEIMPTLNDHAEIPTGADTITFDYAPSAPREPERGETHAERPGIEILSPQPGTVVSGDFEVRVAVTGSDMNCDLRGKPRVRGYGHWHLNLDTTIGPMMGMATMTGMSCEQTLRVSTKGLVPGSTHRLIALLVDNGHAPLEPPAEASVAVVVGS